MNELFWIDKIEKTITSVELWEISWRRHDVLMKSIYRMNNDLLELGKPPVTESSYTTVQWKTLPCFILTIYQCELLALALDWKARIKVMDKITELREKNNKPKTFEEIMRDTLLLANEKVQQLENKIEDDKPRVEFANTVADSSDVILVREYAKLIYDQEWIDIWQNKLYKWFRNNWYLNKKNEPFQHYMKYFKIVETTQSSIFGTKINKTTKITWQWQLYFLPKIRKDYE